MPTKTEREIFSDCTMYFLRESWDNADKCLKILEYKVLEIHLKNLNETVYGMVPDRPFGSVSLR